MCALDAGLLVQGYAIANPGRHGRPCPNQAEVTRPARAVLLEIHDEYYGRSG